MLDQMGYSVRIEYRKIVIIKGTETIMKGLRKNVVFVLDGETVTGEVGISTNANIDSAKLWDLRLWHIGEKGLKELNKQCVFGTDKIGGLKFYEGEGSHSKFQ